MKDMLEKLIMLQILKTMAYSKSEDQKAMLDTILDGADKAARTVANIRSIKEGKEPSKLEPLYKEPIEPEPIIENFNERKPMTIESPTPPKNIMSQNMDTTQLEDAYGNANSLRRKLDGYYEQGMIGKKEINEMIIDIFTLQTKLFQMIKSSGK
jgi:hypothetical protein